MAGRARKRPAFLPVKVVPASAGGVELVLRTGQVIRLQGGFDVARIVELARELEGEAC